MRSRHEVEGKAKQAKGKVKDKAGEWTDDLDLEAEGEAEEVEGPGPTASTRARPGGVRRDGPSVAQGLAQEN